MLAWHIQYNWRSCCLPIIYSGGGGPDFYLAKVMEEEDLFLPGIYDTGGHDLPGIVRTFPLPSRVCLNTSCIILS